MKALSHKKSCSVSGGVKHTDWIGFRNQAFGLSSASRRIPSGKKIL